MLKVGPVQLTPSTLNSSDLFQWKIGIGSFRHPPWQPRCDPLRSDQRVVTPGGHIYGYRHTAGRHTQGPANMRARQWSVDRAL